MKIRRNVRSWYCKCDWIWLEGWEGGRGVQLWTDEIPVRGGDKGEGTSSFCYEILDGVIFWKLLIVEQTKKVVSEEKNDFIGEEQEC